MSFLFKPACNIDIQFLDKDTRQSVELHRDNAEIEHLLVFVGDEPVKGTVHLQLPSSDSRITHTGIKVELLGQIELFYDRGRHYAFTSLLQELSPPGELTESKTYPFEFINVEKQHESYNGINVRLRYFIRVTIGRSFIPDIVKEVDFWVYSYGVPPEINNSIKMEVGIEDCLHIEFEYNKSKYHLKDVIIGKIYFLLVRIKIKHMELQLIKRESTGTGPNLYNESETLTKFEIMDGAPVRGESIPVRMFLSAFDLTPTYKNVHSRFSLKYLLNLVLVDEDDRRYFKQQEVTLWRKLPKKARNHKIPRQLNEPKPSSAEASQEAGSENSASNAVHGKEEEQPAAAGTAAQQNGLHT